MEPKEQVRRYERPPVVERVCTIRASVSDEVFHENLESWKAEVVKQFPCDSSITQWMLNMEERDGLPLLDTIRPELEITPRFSLVPESDGWDQSLRFPKGQLTINLHSAPGDGRGFEALRALYFEWIPRWISHFKVSRAESVSLLYINELSKRTIPEFVADDGGLMVDKVLRVFTSIPGEHEQLLPPFDCKVTLLLKEPEGARMRIQLIDAPPINGPRMILKVIVVAPLPPSQTNQWASIIEECHKRIIERFEVLFTEESKASFLPVEQ